MARRKIPYGFHFVNGKIEICEEEAIIIRRMFGEYLDGKAMYGIGVELFNERLSYFSDSKEKSSCKVSNIIRDERYAGAEDYPAIVDSNTFEKARNRWKDNVYLNPISKKEIPQFTVSENTTYMPSAAVMQLENQLKEMLNGNFEIEETRNMILQLAAEKYSCIQ